MEEREVLSLLIGCCVLFFVLFNWSKIQNLSNARILLLGFSMLFISWCFSVLEDLAWNQQLNFLQHLFSGLSGVTFGWWLRLTAKSSAAETTTR